MHLFEDTVVNLVKCMLVVVMCIFFLLIQAEGVYNQRLQNLAVTLDKVTCFSFFEQKGHHSYWVLRMIICCYADHLNFEDFESLFFEPVLGPIIMSYIPSF